MRQTQITRFAQLLRGLVNSACESTCSSSANYVAFDAAPLRVCRLEERRVLAADVLGGATSLNSIDVAALAGGVSTLSQPSITVPANQSAIEGASLVFSPAAGREIRVDAPGLGAGRLRVDISAFDSLGRVTPILDFGYTAPLTTTGNGVNVFQLEGTLSDINRALASLSFSSPDNGDFNIALVATDLSTGENAGASVDIAVTNALPQIELLFVGGTEGSNIEVPLQVTDLGNSDNPQVSWSVSRRDVVIASGSGSPVKFFANNDGFYELTVTAADKDGGVSSEIHEVVIGNLDPTFSLTGSMQGDFVNLSLVITDPGHELFTVQIYWTDQSTTPEILVTQDRILSLSHRYLPGEIDNELNIAVQVSDDQAFARQTLQFREGDPVSTERPEFAARPREAPPERAAPTRVQPGATTSQIVSAEFGRTGTNGTQTASALYQFVLRVVGPDGEESQSYPLPPESLADLPQFLNSLGVPDGHYRVYLVAGDLERLVIDGHLRAGRIVNPTDERQGGFDLLREEVAATAMDRGDVIDGLGAAMPRQDTGRDTVSIAGKPASAEIEPGIIDGGPAALTATVQIVSPERFVPAPAVPVELEDTPVTSPTANDDTGSNLGMVGGTLVVCAAATAIYTRARHRNNRDQVSPQFNKRARLARKLARGPRPRVIDPSPIPP